MRETKLPPELEAVELKLFENKLLLELWRNTKEPSTAKDMANPLCVEVCVGQKLRSMKRNSDLISTVQGKMTPFQFQFVSK